MTDAIIVLGGGVALDGSLPEYPRSRVEKAVELYKNGRAPIVVMSGGHGYWIENKSRLTEAAAMKQYALTLGVPAEVILEEDVSSHTIANAYFTKKLFAEPRQWHRLTLVSSKDHLPRAEYLFKKIYGPMYDFECEASSFIRTGQARAKEPEHEKTSFERSKEYLETVKDGDDEAIKKLVLQLHPNDTMGRAIH